jgi:hypothetical protein
MIYSPVVWAFINVPQIQLVFNPPVLFKKIRKSFKIAALTNDHGEKRVLLPDTGEFFPIRDDAQKP